MYEPVIGMEVHVQLMTASKMFCGCSADYASAPANTHVCPVCLGMPGVLPVINERAVEYSILTGLALNCEVPAFSRWDRKNYPYPDLPKGYQISQYDHPLARAGYITVEVEGEECRIRIRRAHLEEDTAKLVHAGSVSLVDFNRSGVPLLEIVTEPDIHSAEQARLYLLQLRAILRCLGVSTGNMEDGAMRCEANISLRPEGSSQLPASHVEVKNLNSFRAVKLAVEYEIERQTRLMQRGEAIAQVTMGWDDRRGVTFVQRTKEEALDYRYFPEPDLPPLEVSRDWVERLRAALPELPTRRVRRFVDDLGLALPEARLLGEEREVADYFEAAVAAGEGVSAKTVANWMTGPIFRYLNDAGVSIADLRVGPSALAELIAAVERGDLNVAMGRSVLDEMLSSGRDADSIVKARGLRQISDGVAIEQAARSALAANPRAVDDYRQGKAQALKFLVGQVMKATRGQANARVVETVLVQLLTE